MGQRAFLYAPKAELPAASPPSSWASGFEGLGLGLRVSGFRVLGFRVLGFRVPGLGIKALGFRVLGLQGFGLRGEGRTSRKAHGGRSVDEGPRFRV